MHDVEAVRKKAIQDCIEVLMAEPPLVQTINAYETQTEMVARLVWLLNG